MFKDKQILHLRKGLNVLVGENGCGKITVIDAIRLLLNEDEYARNGISDEDFYSSVDKKYNAILNIDIARKQDRRNNYKKVIWGGSQ